MGSVSFLVLFLLSHSVLLSSAEEERKQPPTCPPFDCEKLGRLHFPFKNENNSECGLCTIKGCTEELPRIQLERDGRYFGVKNISQADTIVIQDDLLKENLQRSICKFIDNLTSSLSPSVSFTPVPTLTATSSLSPSVSFAPVPTLTVLSLFKCHRNHNIDPITEYNYTRCHDFIIYYNHPNTSIPPPPPPPPPHCSIIQYPVNMSLDIADLFPLLTSDITLQVLVSPDCWRCHHRTGQCQDDGKGKFHCAHVKGAQHI